MAFTFFIVTFCSKCARALTFQNFCLNCCSSTRPCSSLPPRSHARPARHTHRDWGEYNSIRNSEENTSRTRLLSLQRQALSKLVPLVVLFSKCTTVLTLENLCVDQMVAALQSDDGGDEGLRNAGPERLRLAVRELPIPGTHSQKN